MELNKNMMQKTVLALVLLAVAALSAFVVSERVSAPEYHKASMEALEEKKITVMEMTAAVAASSIAVAAIPGDATTPLADQIAELGSYLMIAAGAVMLEKFLLAITGHAAFSLLIPAACVLGILGMFLSSGVLKRLALRLAVTGLAIFMVIPASLKVSSLIEEAFEVSQTIEEAEKSRRSGGRGSGGGIRRGKGTVRLDLRGRREAQWSSGSGQKGAWPLCGCSGGPDHH